MNTKTKNFSIWLNFRSYIDELILRFRTSNGSSSEESLPNEDENAAENSNKPKPLPKKKNNKKQQNHVKPQWNSPSKEDIFEKGDKAFLDKKSPEPEEEKQKETKAKLPFPKNIRENKNYRWPDIVPIATSQKNELMIVSKPMLIAENIVAPTIAQPVTGLSEKWIASFYILSCLYPLLGIIFNTVGYISGYHQEQNFVAKYIRFNLNVFISALVYYIFAFNVLELNPILDKVYLNGPTEGILGIFFGEYSWMWIGIYLLLGFNLYRALKGKKPLHLIALPILRK